MQVLYNPIEPWGWSHRFRWVNERLEDPGVLGLWPAHWTCPLHYLDSSVLPSVSSEALPWSVVRSLSRHLESGCPGSSKYLWDLIKRCWLIAHLYSKTSFWNHILSLIPLLYCYRLTNELPIIDHPFLVTTCMCLQPRPTNWKARFLYRYCSVL